MEQEKDFVQVVFKTSSLYAWTLRNAKTRSQFKSRNATKGTTSYQLRQFAEATLGSGSLRTAVKLPEGEDLSEWLAVNGQSTNYALGNLPRPPTDLLIRLIDVIQLLISTIKSIFFMDPSRSSVRRNHAPR